MDWETFALNLGLPVLFTVVKNPKRVLQLRAALIKLRDALIALNLGDKGSPAPQALVDAAKGA